nr:hypothetical protein [Pseudomonas sp. F01002]
MGVHLISAYLTLATVLASRMKEHHNATLIGYRTKGATQPSINPPSATRVEGGELFYIASTRLKEISNGMV